MPKKSKRLAMGRVISALRGSAFRAKRDYIVQVDPGLSADKPSSLLGRKVLWSSSHVKIAGRIISVHGKKAVVVRFRRGLPGQAIGTRVFILGGLPISPGVG